MKCEAEGPTGYFSGICLLISCLGGPNHIQCIENVVLRGWSVVIPPEAEGLVQLERIMDPPHHVIEWEALKIDPIWNNPPVTPAEVCKDT